MFDHVTIRVSDRAASERFYETVLGAIGVSKTAGYTDNGPPGERSRYHDGYYAAYVLDPAGANVEVVNHNRT
jgi:catechol 2,3-dioxygenase-like lactoylglutathione lyase family enzyme